MAAIPTYLYFGDEMICGGAQPPTNLPDLWGRYLNNWRFSRFVPCGPDGYSADPASGWPCYWDGSVGEFVRYQYIAGLGSAAKGDNWFLPAGGGITPCTMLMNALWARHLTSPGFRLLKYAKLGAGYGSWKPGGAAWNEARAQWDLAVADEATRGNTLDVKAVIVDCSAADIRAGSLTFSVDLQALITGIRANYSATCQIILVSHRSDFYTTGGSASQSARNLHSMARVANAGVHVFDMAFAEWGTDGIVGGTTPGPANITYETIDYVDAGVRLGRMVDALLTNQPIAEADGPLGVHVFLGDSNFITSFMKSDQVVAGKQRSLLGDVGGTQRSGQWIYDDPNGQVVPYDVMGVTNSTGATLEHFFGPEATFLARVAKKSKNPNAHQCLFKFAIGGSSLGFLETGWPAVVAAWRRFCAAVYRDTGRMVDTQDICINYGHNDGLEAGGASNFEAKATLLIDMARELFTTRSSGPELLVNWVQNAPHSGNGWPGGTNHGDPASNERVRQHIAKLPTLRPRVKVLLNGDYETKEFPYELNRDDDIHLGGEATKQVGYDLADLVLAYADDATDADQVGGEETTQLVEAAADTSPAGIVAILEAAIATGSDVASYTTATGQTVTLRSFTEILRALQYFEAKASRKAGLRRTRVVFTS